MPAEWCKCGRPLTGNARREVEVCRACERSYKKEIADVSEYVESLPTIEDKDGLIYIIERQPEFED